VTDTDTMVERILTGYDTITVVGASRAAAKAAHSVPAHMQRHGWRIIPVNPYAEQILGEQVYRRIGEDRCLIIEQRRLGLEAPRA
jgi:uncharacterized protein